jgi:3-oxoacyl-[acyl-carrier-protein] synthase I
MFVIDYDCLTAAGPHKENLMTALFEGKVCSHHAEKNDWQSDLVPGGLVALIQNRDATQSTVRDYLSQNLNALWKQIYKNLSQENLTQFMKSKVGLVFASTKGCVEDYIHKISDEASKNQSDPFFDICQDFTKLNPEISFAKSLTVSNACCSSHVALEYVQDIFDSQQLDFVILIAADLVGPFVYKGFNSLKVLSHTENRPFASDRDGLQLGEALAVVLLSRKPGDSKIQISQVASDTEGSSITRPSVNGLGLIRSLQKIKSKRSDLKPDLVIAHGTGTRFNDQAEDQALGEFLHEIGKPLTPITNTKWAIGHTLGASGCVDLIAGCEILKKQKVFSIKAHDLKDPQFKMNYLLGDQNITEPVEQILVTSLGFGGVHASLLLEKKNL